MIKIFFFNPFYLVFSLCVGLITLDAHTRARSLYPLWLVRLLPDTITVQLHRETSAREKKKKEPMRLLLLCVHIYYTYIIHFSPRKDSLRLIRTAIKLRLCLLYTQS